MESILDADYTESPSDGDSDATEFPIATDELAKGSRVPAEEIERAFGAARGSDRYRLNVLRVRDYVTRRLAARGLLVTVIQERDEIAILTDEEALAYNARRFDIETRQRNRCFLRLGQTDRANLSEPSRRVLDTKLTELGRRISADRKARREITLKAAERATPGALPEPGKP